jgi:hypothetical protein
MVPDILGLAGRFSFLETRAHSSFQQEQVPIFSLDYLCETLKINFLLIEINFNLA